jgi:hypothetical protein
VNEHSHFVCPSCPSCPDNLTGPVLVFIEI